MFVANVSGFCVHLSLSLSFFCTIYLSPNEHTSDSQGVCVYIQSCLCLSSMLRVFVCFSVDLCLFLHLLPLFLWKRLWFSGCLCLYTELFMFVVNVAGLCVHLSLSVSFFIQCLSSNEHVSGSKGVCVYIQSSLSFSCMLRAYVCISVYLCFFTQCPSPHEHASGSKGVCVYIQSCLCLSSMLRVFVCISSVYLWQRRVPIMK